MKLLIDMNLSPRWVDVLSAAGFEVLHATNTWVAKEVSVAARLVAKANVSLKPISLSAITSDDSNTHETSISRQ